MYLEAWEIRIMKSFITDEFIVESDLDSLTKWSSIQSSTLIYKENSFKRRDSFFMPYRNLNRS